MGLGEWLNAIGICLIMVPLVVLLLAFVPQYGTGSRPEHTPGASLLHLFFASLPRMINGTTVVVAIVIVAVGLVLVTASRLVRR